MTHRRTASELDIYSMRRISDALLLAQNRARRATDRAHQAEHVLHLVLSQVDVPTLRVDSLADWEMLRAAVTANPLLSSSPRRAFDPAEDMGDVAKDVVANLNAAMACHTRYVATLTLPTLHFSLWRHTDALFGPLQFVAGVVAGVMVGVVAARQWRVQVMHTQETPTLVGKLAKWCSRRAPAPGTPWHLMPLPTDEYSYLMHPTVVA